MTAQLPLGLAFEVNFTFDNFLLTNGNNKTRLAHAGLVQLADANPAEPLAPVVLWGQSGGGKTHLLQACCQQAADNGLSLAYLPLDQLQQLGPGVLENQEQQDLICIDQLEVVQSQPEWESALFTLFNRVRERQSRLLVAGRNPPSAATRDDLSSRLAWGITIELPATEDENKAQILQQRANTLGLELADEATSYLLQRAPRGMHELMALLNQLDQASLASQRRLTVPLIREVLAST